MPPETPRTWTLIRGLHPEQTVVFRASGALLRDEEIVDVIEKAPVDAEIERLTRERDDLYSQVVGAGILASDADEAVRGRNAERERMLDLLEHMFTTTGDLEPGWESDIETCLTSHGRLPKEGA
jgi:hypothetical protein